MSDLDDLDAAFEHAQLLEPDVAPGEYIARAVSVQYRTSTFKGAPCFSVRLVIQEGSRRGQFLWINLWLNGGALPISMRTLERLGFAGLKPREILAYQRFDHLPCVVARVIHEEYEGRKHVVVSAIRKRDQRPSTGSEDEGHA
jgi:hypothetical protein